MINEKIFCGVDIGTHSIKAALLKVKRPHHWKLLGAYEVPVEGLQKSTVNDLFKLSESIADAMKGLKKLSSAAVKDVHLGIGGHLIMPRFTKAVIPLVDSLSKIVGAKDIKKVNRQANLLGTKIEEHILHELPQYYTVDDINKALNPMGLYGRKLGVCTLLLLTPANLTRNITKAVNTSGYDVVNVSFGSLAASHVTLSEERKKKGCLLIDVGSETINLFFFSDGILRHIDTLRFGGSQMTKNLSEVLKVSVELAENIKLSHGRLGDDVRGKDDILLKKDDRYVPIKRKMVNEVLETYAEKFIQAIESILKTSHIHNKLEGGVVIIGGGSLLPGLIERIEKTLNVPVSMPKLDLDAPDLKHPVVYSSAIGVAKDGFQKTTNPLWFSASKSSWVTGMSHRVKELYHEYF